MRTALTEAAPLRTCVGCRRVRPKAELVRLVRTSAGVAVPDAQGRGRGAYVCPDSACVKRAAKPGRLQQAFRKVCVAGPDLAGVPDRRG
jgi:predicted RNA-binding protein YlxR (DUF448 family)